MKNKLIASILLLTIFWTNCFVCAAEYDCLRPLATGESRSLRAKVPNRLSLSDFTGEHFLQKLLTYLEERHSLYLRRSPISPVDLISWASSRDILHVGNETIDMEQMERFVSAIKDIGERLGFRVRRIESYNRVDYLTHDHEKTGHPLFRHNASRGDPRMREAMSPDNPLIVPYDFIGELIPYEPGKWRFPRPWIIPPEMFSPDASGPQAKFNPVGYVPLFDKSLYKDEEEYSQFLKEIFYPYGPYPTRYLESMASNLTCWPRQYLWLPGACVQASLKIIEVLQHMHSVGKISVEWAIEIRTVQNNHSAVLAKFTGDENVYVFDRTLWQFAGTPDKYTANFLLGWYAVLPDKSRPDQQLPHYEEYKQIYEFYQSGYWVANVKRLWIPDVSDDYYDSKRGKAAPLEKSDAMNMTATLAQI